MKISILRLGEVYTKAVNHLKNKLPTVFPRTTCILHEKVFPIPKESFNPTRRQYYSSVILSEIRDLTLQLKADVFLGVTEVDLYVPGLNFVFGEAECPGKAALISLKRLRPTFYGQPDNENLFLERALKEAVHEIGHVLGLKHCKNPGCVMFFSNSIMDTDRKRPNFCGQCTSTLLRKPW